MRKALGSFPVFTPVKVRASEKKERSSTDGNYTT